MRSQQNRKRVVSSLRNNQTQLTSVGSQLKHAYMVFGRSQGSEVSQLLPPSYKVYYNKAFQNRKKESTLDLPTLDLRYDVSRFCTIAYFYEIGGWALEDILWPLIDASMPTPFEYYYPDAKPDKNGSCPRCHEKMPRVPMKQHLLQCCQASKISAAESLIRSHCNNEWQCFWDDCSSVFSDFKLFTLHTSSHVDSGPDRCLWNSCSYYKADDIHAHLLELHSVYTDQTSPTNIRFCFQCSKWLYSKCEWSHHVKLHSRAATTTYGPIFVNGLMISPGRCAYCVKAGLYDKFDNIEGFISHVNRHMMADAWTS
ncbi:unnamed protein product [Periconia digitata]|uniref:C2H2-type domain-containing protein n=1 Tax=Periconia digitata TaxID=1303443 RepID=A0A9W4UI89_9PLEO|nr:unnamed protein product [Periconia digitata]